MKTRTSLTRTTCPKTMAWRLRTACAARLLPLFFFLAMPAVVGAQYDYTTTNGTITITRYTGPGGAVDIPSMINGFPVTRIKMYAFSYCTSLTSITIPDSVTSIGDEAFRSCTGLTNVTIGNSVSSIGEGAFFECSFLAGVTIPNSVTNIGNGAFSSCARLSTITIPNSVTSIGWYTFQYCLELTSVTIPNSVISIGGSAFYCTSLTSVTIPNSVTSIGFEAFGQCTSLRGVTIGNSVSSIGKWAFRDCTNLTSVTIPNSVTSIGEGAFDYCTSLASITVDATNSVYTSVDGVLFNKSQTTLIQYPGGKTGGYMIPNSVTIIGWCAFAYCTRLTSVTIPNSVTGVWVEAFHYCTSLTKVTIGNSVTSIGDGAFGSCTSLTNVVIGNSVTRIGYGAFGSCTSLTSVTIPNSVTSIGYQAFIGCTSLTSVTIPDSVTSIGEEAFRNCTSLRSVTIGNAVTSIGKNAFFLCTNLTNVMIGTSVTYIYDQAFGACTSLTSVTIPNNVTYIGSYAFVGCYNLTSVTIPNRVTSVGTSTFSGCTRLTSIAIPNSVTSIGYAAFASCTSLASVTIPNSVTSIGEGAFASCTSLTGIYFQGNAPSLGSNPFYGDNNATVYYLAGTTGWGPTFGGLPTKLWTLSPNVTVSNIRGSQRPGTTLVDLYYDLSGPGLGYAISVTVSSDGGNSFTVPSTHFTGDGVTSTVAPGTGRHIVWDAGADFPGQFSTKMRLKVSVGSAFAVSPIFTLDTRAVSTGSLTGLVQGGGKPVANAQARIDGTSFAASTGADGRFTLANVPAGSGYLLKVSAAGFASKPVPGITVTSGTKDLGTVQLATLGGPYRLLQLQPDVNPPVTQIEDGGVGYRYYKVVTADGKTAAGGVAVSVRAAGGSTISQAGDVSDSWAGRVAGVSDDTGIVRLRIPASALGSGVQTLQVVESGAVKAQFQASVVKFWHDKVWKHQVEAGASTSKAILRLGASGALETEVRDHYAGSLLLDETIQRSRVFEARLGVGFDFPGPSLSVDLGSNLRGGFKVIDTYGFPPDTTDQLLNMEKVYMALGDEMSVVLGPAPQIYDELRKIYAPDLYAAILRSTAGEIHGGGEFDASAELSVGVGTSQSLYFGADLEGGIIGYYQAENQFQVGRLVERTRELGLRTELSTSLNLNAGGRGLSGQTLKKLGLSGNISQKATMAGKVWLDPATSAPLSVGAEFESEVSAGMDVSLLGWQGVGGSLGPGMAMSAKESLRYDLPSATAYAHIQTLSPVWNYLVGGFGAGRRLTGQAGSGLLPAIVVASEQDGVPLTYERSVYRGVTTDVAAQADLDKVLDKLGLKFDLSMERGAEAVVEKGVIWQRERMPLKWRPEDTMSLIPLQSIVSKEAQWIGYAAPPLAQAWNRVEQAVAAVGETMIKAGTGAYQAVLQFGQGVMNASSYVVTKWTASGSVSGSSRAPMMYGLQGLQSKAGNSPNLVYGIGGIYRFESTNSFNGIGTLTITYSPAEVTGLNPADLRIYYLPDGTNRWQLVGGTVNVASNTVTATISRLGTYTLAPPMPTGDLQLTLSTNTMAADGVSQMTVVATNLALNTGNVATQQWMFTATAVGVSILNPDLDAATSGVQVMSTNGAVTLLLRAPISGTVGRVNLASVVGDAFGSTAINLLDNAPPATPAGVDVTAGQSRIWISWRTNSEPDLAGYRVYYRMGVSGPPWDGTAAVEGTPSPVMVTGTNCLLRGLALGTNYFVTVSAVDTTGNESPLSAPAQVTTTATPPAPPTAVVARFGADGTNILMWALSEDDGYNDRDVAHYEVLRAVLPGGSYAKVAEVGAGIGLYSETNLAVSATQYVSYAVVAVASSGSSSAQSPGNRLMASGTGFDNDGDGTPDWWMMQYFGHPTGQASDQSLAQDDPDREGLTNLHEYLWGTNPGVMDRPYLVSSVSTSNGVFVLSIEGVFGRSVTLQTSHDLSSWVTVTNFNGTNVSIPFEDRTATNSTQRFYRAIVP